MNDLLQFVTICKNLRTELLGRWRQICSDKKMVPLLSYNIVEYLFSRMNVSKKDEKNSSKILLFFVEFFIVTGTRVNLQISFELYLWIWEKNISMQCAHQCTYFKYFAAFRHFIPPSFPLPPPSFRLPVSGSLNCSSFCISSSPPVSLITTHHLPKRINYFPPNNFAKTKEKSSF